MEILCYGVIGDPLDKCDAATVCTAIRNATGPLSIRINSPGGFVMEGLAIVEAIRSYPDKVTIYVDGLAASMASVIAMVGAECIMAESSLMMVHKPWDASIGNADDLRRDAAKLDRIEAQLIGIYAKRTGLPEGELVAMLAAETWMTADEALAAGFATSISPALKLAAMADVSACGFRHIPDQLKEPTMTDTAQAVATERTRISTITGLCNKHRLPADFAQAMVDKGTPLEKARELILDRLATESDALNIGHSFSGHVTLDNPTTYTDAVKGALVAKISGKAAEGPAAEFRSMSVVDIARDFLARNGERDVLRLSPDRAINMAMSSGNPYRGARSWGTTANIGGMHTTSDFPDLIGGAAEKYLVDRYKLQQSQLKQLARRRDVNNFLDHFGIQSGSWAALDQVNEAGEYKNRSLSTRKEGYRIATFGNMFAVSRQMLVNDGMGALADILNIMAAGAAETEATVLAALINSNIPLSDSKSWFHADHKNLATSGGAPSITTLDAGRLAMRSQKDFGGGGLIDANPKFLLVPATLQTAAETLVASTIAPTTTADVNPFANKLVPISDPRLTNATAWYLFADPDFSPALQYSYLDGQDAPFTDSQDGWRTDGTEYKVRHDFGAGVLDYRFAWKNAGA
ncbi:head maturation protease, ClpP-related [Sphingomonas sp. ID0503]|uniref:head maturation protease, ClpP-related n=1 Tax=Sphingomonas sp. ID0503 TaxID=3399691 RepID=UPI003AFAE2AC